MESQVDPDHPPSLWTGPRDDPRRYRVELVDGRPVDVGGGGEGLVFEAHRRVIGDEGIVALKMHTELTVDDFSRFAERARALKEIDHPHVMHLIDAFVGTALIDEDDPEDDAFSVMYTVAEWIPGLSLPAALEATSKASGLHWVSQIARAADYLHGFRSSAAPAGVVHRDIKPSNVRITPEENAVLLDFGIARPHQEGDHTEGAGTYLWKAPEVLGGPGDPGPPSDAWGVGALAYWVLLAEPPRLEGAAAARELLTPAARSAGFVDPKGLSRRIAELLETHPLKRPRDLSRWADEMERRASGKRPLRLGRLAAVAAVVVALVGGATAATIALVRTTPPSPSQSRMLAAEATRALPTNVEKGSLLSLAAYTRGSTSQARRALVDSLEQPLDGILHDGSPVTSVAYGGGGALLAGGDAAGNVEVWNTKSLRQVAQFQVHSPVTGVALSPDGRFVAVGDVAGHVVVRGTSGRTGKSPVLDVGLKVTSVAFSPDGTLVAVGVVAVGKKIPGKVVAWNPSSGQTKSQSVPHGAAVTSVAFDPDAPLIIAGDESGQLDFWDTSTHPTQKTGFVATGYGLPITSVAFNDDGQSMATGDDGGHVQLWSTRGDVVGVVPHDTSPVQSVAFSRSGTTLATGDAGGNVALWSTTGDTEIGRPLHEPGSVSSVAFGPGDRSLAVGDVSGNVMVWDTSGRTADLTSSDVTAAIDSVAFNRVGGLLATGGYAGDVDLWNSITDEELGQLRGTGGQIYSVALNADGSLLATGDKGYRVALWNTLTKTEEWVHAEDSYVYGVAFDPTAPVLATGNAGGQAVLWNTATGSMIGHALTDGHGSVRTLTFNPTGTLLATGEDGGYVTLWRTSTGKATRTLLVSPGRIVRSVAFSPDGTILAAGDGDGYTTLFDTATGAQISRLFDGSPVLSVAFSHDGHTLVTGDGHAIVTWSVAAGTETSPPIGVDGPVYSVAVSSDGSRLAFATDTQSVTVVPTVVVTASTAALAVNLCDEVRENLTPVQWDSDVQGNVPYQKVCPAF